MYNVQILSDAEFESLPYPETETSLGIADPTTNTAYVRYTHSEELNKYLVNHELEHLIEGHGGEHSDHYRHGVYYKGAGGILGMLAPILSIFNPILGAVAGAGGGLLGQREQAKQQQSAMAQQGQQGSQQTFAQQGPPITTFPSQQAQGTPLIGNAPSSTGPSGSSGALSGTLTGTPVDKVRDQLQTGNQGNFLKGNYGLRGSL